MLFVLMNARVQINLNSFCKIVDLVLIISDKGDSTLEERNNKGCKDFTMAKISPLDHD